MTYALPAAAPARRAPPAAHAAGAAQTGQPDAGADCDVDVAVAALLAPSPAKAPKTAEPMVCAAVAYSVAFVTPFLKTFGWIPRYCRLYALVERARDGERYHLAGVSNAMQAIIFGHKGQLLSGRLL